MPVAAERTLMSRLIPLGAVLVTLLYVPAAAGIDLQLGAESATVTGLPAGGRAVVLSGWRERVLDAVTRVTRIQEIVEDQDGDGVAELVPSAPIPTASLWIAVDLATGDAVAVAPGGYRLRDIGTDPRQFRRGVGRFAVGRTDLEILAVRPGVGAWYRPVSDGGPEDDDGTADGQVTPVLAALEPLGDSPPIPLDGLETGDVLAAIDVRTMELFAVRVTD